MLNPRNVTLTLELLDVELLDVNLELLDANLDVELRLKLQIHVYQL